MKTRTKNAVKRLLGGAISVALSLAMALCIFAGMGIEVRAEEKWEFVSVTLPNSWDEFIGMTFVDYGAISDSDRQEISSLMNSKFDLYVIGKRSGGDLFCMVGGANNYMYKDHYINIPSTYGTCYILQRKPKNTESTGSSESSGSVSDSYTFPHTHSYAWETVQEVTVEQDGIEEYRCSCGDVQERNIIPASEALVKGLFGEIKDAPFNGTTSFDTGRQYTLSDYIIRKLSERTDVAVTITFQYEDQSYRMTIPAGADYSQLLADEDYFYGYFYFANAVGAVIEAV